MTKTPLSRTRMKVLLSRAADTLEQLNQRTQCAKRKQHIGQALAKTQQQIKELGDE